eukprot:scaffold2114_cov142-Skeletonema_dohrnii-CCMP3373.AAC.4
MLDLMEEEVHDEIKNKPVNEIDTAFLDSTFARTMVGVSRKYPQCEEKKTWRIGTYSKEIKTSNGRSARQMPLQTRHSFNCRIIYQRKGLDSRLVGFDDGCLVGRRKGEMSDEWVPSEVLFRGFGALLMIKCSSMSMARVFEDDDEIDRRDRV